MNDRASSVSRKHAPASAQQRGGPAALAVSLSLIAGATLSSGCRDKPPPQGLGASAKGPAPSASASAMPDRLAEGELPPGTTSAFGLALPRGARLERSFPDRIFVVAPLSAERSSSWLRKQHGELEATIGPSGTIFPRITPEQAMDGHTVRVEIQAGGASDSTWVVDAIAARSPVTNVPANSDEAMRSAGLNPQTGGVLAPEKSE